MSAHVWRSLVALTRMEILRTLRTREVWTRMLGPALSLPVVVLGLAMLALPWFRWSTPVRVVAVTPDVPVELDLAAAFASEGWTVRVFDDPKAALDAGEAELAITRWLPGSGLGAPLNLRVAPMDVEFWTPNPYKADRYLWTVHVWDSEATEDEAIPAFRAIEESVLQAEVSSHGLPEDTLDWPLQLRRLELDPEASEGAPKPLTDLPPILGYQIRPIDIVHGLTVILGSAVGLQLLALTPVADRSEGILETLATTAAPVRVVLLARLVAGVLFLTLGIGLMMLPFAGLLRVSEGAAYSMFEVATWMTSGVIFIAATYLPVGLWCRSIQDANSFGGYASLVATAGAGALVWLSPGSAFLCAVLWSALWIVVLGWTPTISSPPKADTP